MRIGLIVGVSGRIGNSLLESLLNNRRYKKVILLSRRENKRKGNIHLKKVNVDFADMENYSEEFFIQNFPARTFKNELLKNEVTGIEFQPIELSINEWLQGGEREKVNGKA
jgi:putative NADH-flavin reductase